MRRPLAPGAPCRTARSSPAQRLPARCAAPHPILLLLLLPLLLVLAAPAARAVELSEEDRVLRDENLAKLDRPLEEMRPKELQELLRVRGACAVLLCCSRKQRLCSQLCLSTGSHQAVLNPCGPACGRATCSARKAQSRGPRRCCFAHQPWRAKPGAR